MKSPHALMNLLTLYASGVPKGHAIEAMKLDAQTLPELPKVVCLCGSTRFYEQFQRYNFEETMAGRIVLSVGFYPHGGFESKALHGGDVGVTPEQKVALDVLHKQKIDLADEVLVLNVGGYIGDSTRSEVAHARATGKPVRWLEHSDDVLFGESVERVNDDRDYRSSGSERVDD